MKEGGWHVGMAMKQNPYLQIPLHARYHVGDQGIDYGIGVITWEGRYGAQMDHLLEVSEWLGYDVFECAKEWQATE